MNYDFFKVACVSPDLVVADCFYNAEQIILNVKNANKKGASLIVFPELSITGFSCGDLFFQKTLQNQAIQSLLYIAKNTKSVNALIFVGLPLSVNNCLYDCACALYKGEILAFIPKTNVLSYDVFNQARQFSKFSKKQNVYISIDENLKEVPFGNNIIFTDRTNSDFAVGCELGQDLFMMNAPSVLQVKNGANIIVNLAADAEKIDRQNFRKNMIQTQSKKCCCAYLFSSASNSESTQEVVFSSSKLIYENGELLAESNLYENQILYSDIDVGLLALERQKNQFEDFSQNEDKDSFLKIQVDISNKKNPQLDRKIPSSPFIPQNIDECNERCLQVVKMQANALAKRLKHTNCKSAVIGLSGGLDSTLALLITTMAFDLCNLPRKSIYSITMPCFGTTDRTYNNACKLANECGTTLKEINISQSVKMHFQDIGQDENVHDVTYENSQARERTQVLMDFANKINGIVIGTGDLSELALGWCTYNGDHMSMYGVNAGIPKTFMRYLVNWFAQDAKSNNKNDLGDVLIDILETPVSPELLPPEEGNISQKTENLVGPYELHDFYLYYVLKYGFSPSKILFLAEQSDLKYSRAEKIKWLKIFYRRFFTQQFKRSCMPDGISVGFGSLSPRGSWTMPTDSSANVWLKEIEELEKGE